MTGILIETIGPIGHLILSQPATLNSLTLEMITALQDGLNQHESDPSVQVIIIRSNSERAFCAGGNMKLIRELSMAGDFATIDEFFKHEYALNLAIAQCKKPYIAIIDGVAMGGGLGLSVHAKTCVVTERAVLAMPESRIGFFPDVGASYFLQRLANNAGLWLALTTAPVKGVQAMQVGLATHFVQRDALSRLFADLQAQLMQENQSPDECVTQCLAKASSTSDNQKNAQPDNQQFAAILDARAQWFKDADINLIRQRLQNASESEDAQHLLQLLNDASPHSVTTTLKLFTKTKGKSLSECQDSEYQLSVACCKHPDFIEGVRAVLVDKDRNPIWQY